jgi:hypothetical protein
MKLAPEIYMLYFTLLFFTLLIKELVTSNTRTCVMCTVCSRYGQHVKTFANYDSRDLHRLSKEDIVQVAIYEADAGVLLFVSC